MTTLDDLLERVTVTDHGTVTVDFDDETGDEVCAYVVMFAVMADGIEYGVTLASAPDPVWRSGQHEAYVQMGKMAALERAGLYPMGPADGPAG